MSWRLLARTYCKAWASSSGMTPGLRLHGGGEAKEIEGVYPVGSFAGEASHGLGEISGLAGIDDGDGDARGCDGGGGETLVSSCGLHDDEFRIRSSDTGEDLLHTRLIVGKNEGLTLRGAGFVRQECTRRGSSWKRRYRRGLLFRVCSYGLSFILFW